MLHLSGSLEYGIPVFQVFALATANDIAPWPIPVWSVHPHGNPGAD